MRYKRQNNGLSKTKLFCYTSEGAMPFIPESILSLLANFAEVFTCPTWRNAQILLIGAILSNGKRTVSAALRVMGLSDESNFSKFHRVLNGARWDSWRLTQILLGLLLALVPNGCPIIIAMDETLERRKGEKIKDKGCYRDSCRSTKSLVIKCFGLKWQCAALLVKFPWSSRSWALPFMAVLCKSKTYDGAKTGYPIVTMTNKNSKLPPKTLGYCRGKFYYATPAGCNELLDAKLAKKLLLVVSSASKLSRKLTLIRQNIHKLGKKDMAMLIACCGIRRINHRSSVDYALLMMVKIKRYLNRPWILLGDGGFACVKLAEACHKNGVTLISRLRLDAALYEFPEESSEKRRGPKKLKGAKAQSLAELKNSATLAWQEKELTWYGGIKKVVKLFSGTHLWYKAGYKPLAIKWVLVQIPGSERVEVFFSTDTNLSDQKIIECFVLRWNLEVTFEEVRAHLGVETQRQWSDNAINQTTPVLMGLFSLVCLMGIKLADGSKIPTLVSAWYYQKRQVTFSDVISYVKQAIIREKYLKMSGSNDEVVQIPWAKFKDLINQGLIAA